jgi:hypothetical protein
MAGATMQYDPDTDGAAGTKAFLAARVRRQGQSLSGIAFYGRERARRSRARPP